MGRHLVPGANDRGAFAGQELTEHTAAIPVILQTMTGVLDVTASGETVRLLPGAWLTLAASEPHTVVAQEPSVLLLTMLKEGLDPDVA